MVAEEFKAGQHWERSDRRIWLVMPLGNGDWQAREADRADPILITEHELRAGWARVGEQAD